MALDDIWPRLIDWRGTWALYVTQPYPTGCTCPAGWGTVDEDSPARQAYLVDACSLVHPGKCVFAEAKLIAPKKMMVLPINDDEIRAATAGRDDCLAYV